MGNKENQRKMINKIWEGDSEKKPYTLKQKLTDHKPTEEEWLEVVSSFKSKLEKVKEEKSRLTDFMKNEEQFEKLCIERKNIEGQLSHAQKEVDKQREDRDLLSTELEMSKQQKEKAMDELKVLQSTRPSFFIYLFNKTVRTHYKRALNSTLAEYNQLIEDIAKQKNALHELDLKVDKLSKVQERCQKDYDKVILKHTQLLEVTEAARQELKMAYADASFWERIEQKKCKKFPLGTQ